MTEIYSKNYLKLLIDDGEGFCAGNFYETKIKNCLDATPEFISINPLSNSKDHAYFLNEEKYSEDRPRRADLNVTSFRNFLFEIDVLPLDDQLKIFKSSKIPFNSLVFSGGKSIHAILSLEDGLSLDPHTIIGVDSYKEVWERMAAQINREARILGYDPSVKSFVDSSCKNPSRFTRFPGFLRNGEMEQSQIFLSPIRLDHENFYSLLDSCPRVLKRRKSSVEKPEDVVYNYNQFCRLVEGSKPLYHKMNHVDWGAPAGMYPEIFRISLWCIDELNASKEVLLQYLHEKTFPQLLNLGYPFHKLETAVNHAYQMKGM